MSWSIEVHVWHILNTKDDEVIVINLILVIVCNKDIFSLRRVRFFTMKVSFRKIFWKYL